MNASSYVGQAEIKSSRHATTVTTRNAWCAAVIFGRPLGKPSRAIVRISDRTDPLGQPRRRGMTLRTESGMLPFVLALALCAETAVQTTAPARRTFDNAILISVDGLRSDALIAL